MNRRLFPTNTVLLVFALALFGSVPWAAGQITIPREARPEIIREVLQKGESLETERRWSEALSHYEDALRKHPGDQILQQRFDLAKIHYNLGRRYGDPSFRKALHTVPVRSALELYSDLMLKVDTHYVATPPWRDLIRRGTISLDAALNREAFRKENLSEVSQDQITQFRRDLYRLVRSRTIGSRHDARHFVEEIAQQASFQLGIPPTAVVFEYVCGAAGGLDDYSSYLTGNQLKEIYSQIEGNFVGLGVELKADGEALLIVHVIPGSPAEQNGIRDGDRIVGVNGQPTSELSTDQAASLLQGEEGTFADVTLLTSDHQTRRVRVRREHVEVPSIERERIIDEQNGIGYLKLSSFQKTTNRELDSALWKLHRSGMRSLILDLRGNPGGLLTAAVEVSDKFLPQGLIVSTQGRSAGEDFRYQAHEGGTWNVPLVVLIDGDSASASEIFAAAIHHYRRGTVVGTRSYGKGSVQGIFPLSAAGAGVRLTTAKFYSPSGQAISKRGVEPHVVVRSTAKMTAASDPQANHEDAVLDAGLNIARRQFSAG